MATFNKFNCFVEDLAEKKHNLGSDTLKLALTNSAPLATNTVLANITQITAANGYVSGGNTVTITSSSQTSGTYKLVGNDVTFTASGGAMAQFRYVVLYNDTEASDALIGYWDNGSAVDLVDTQSFVVDFNATNGILQLS